MKYTIFQMPLTLWHKNQLFFDEETPVQLTNYNAVWTGELQENFENPFQALDSLFHTFNVDHPENYAGRSLSAGDVVYLEGTYYLCCSFGWSLVKERIK